MKHQPWRRLASETVYDARIFRLRKDSYEFAGQPTHPIYVLEAPAWVNVVATTRDQRVVLVRQFRLGVEQSSLEAPGGIIDPEDRDPASAAARELLEETGYQGRIEPLLTVTSNPAILDNKTHFFLVRDAERIDDPTPDGHEEIEVVHAPATEVVDLIRSGEIHHSLSVAALMWWLGTRDT